MPSSPNIPASSPSKDHARFAILPQKSKALKTLEYACAKARTDSRADKENVPFKAQNSSSQKQVAGCKPDCWSGEGMIDDGEATDTDVDEAITPCGSDSLASPSEHTLKYGRIRGSAPVQVRTSAETKHMDDIDAARLLLGLRGDSIEFHC
jgi:hypothetical protein